MPGITGAGHSNKLNMKHQISNLTTRLIRAGLLAVATFVSVEQKTFAAAPPTDPAHAAHVAAVAMPADAAKGDPALSQQVSQLRAKVAQLEATLAKISPPMAAASTGAAMPGMPGMSAGATPAPPMAGMSGTAAPAGGSMGMMGMMDKMMGMMDKMMSMGGGAMPAGAPMAGGGMSMMDDDDMEMAGMMGMGGGAMPQSAMPGFPGASHLYHIGATGFFLDHPQHIALTIQQQAALNTAKEQALLAKSTADRAVEQAEQELWMLTAADQPDAAKIEAKLAEIGKLRGDERLAFIRAVGDASKILTDEQRKILTGFAPPVSAAPMTGMKDM